MGMGMCRVCRKPLECEPADFDADLYHAGCFQTKEALAKRLHS